MKYYQLYTSDYCADHEPIICKIESAKKAVESFILSNSVYIEFGTLKEIEMGYADKHGSIPLTVNYIDQYNEPESNIFYLKPVEVWL